MSEAEKKMVATYAKALESLSDEARAELVLLLSKPTITDDKTVDERFWSSFGGWPSNKSAEEIIEEIRSARKFRDKDLRF